MMGVLSFTNLFNQTPNSPAFIQGMDSVAAVFVRLCFPDEALAAACLSALLRTKLSIFFSSDGFTHGLRQFFDILLRLFAFHNPNLAVSLTDLNVPLVGLTTGWIYTLFAHAMPLDRVELMWDTLIVGPPSLSMFYYLAIFLQLDQQVNFEVSYLNSFCYNSSTGTLKIHGEHSMTMFTNVLRAKLVYSILLLIREFLV